MFPVVMLTGRMKKYSVTLRLDNVGVWTEMVGKQKQQGLRESLDAVQVLWFSRPGLFNRSIALSTRQITIQRISIGETNCATQWMQIYPVDSVIHHLNNWGQDHTKICSAASLIDNNVIRFLQHAQVLYQIPLASAVLLVTFFSAKIYFHYLLLNAISFVTF